MKFLLKVMTSEAQQRSTLVMGGSRRHRCQGVNRNLLYKCCLNLIDSHSCHFLHKMALLKLPLGLKNIDEDWST